MSPVLQVRTLGRLTLYHQNNPQSPLEPFPTPPTIKSQSLLAYLIFHRQRPHPRERLIGMFWGDRPERKARRSLSTALWHIRRCFSGDDPIRGYAQTLRFEFPGEIWLDAEAFGALASQRDRDNLAYWQIGSSQTMKQTLEALEQLRDKLDTLINAISEDIEGSAEEPEP